VQKLQPPDRDHQRLTAQQGPLIYRGRVKKIQNNSTGDGFVALPQLHYIVSAKFAPQMCARIHAHRSTRSSKELAPSRLLVRVHRSMLSSKDFSCISPQAINMHMKLNYWSGKIIKRSAESSRTWRPGSKDPGSTTCTPLARPSSVDKQHTQPRDPFSDGC